MGHHHTLQKVLSILARRGYNLHISQYLQCKSLFLVTFISRLLL